MSRIVAPGSSQTSELIVGPALPGSNVREVTFASHDSAFEPDPLLGGLTWRLIALDDGASVIDESADHIVEVYRGHYKRPYAAPDEGTYVAVWREGWREIGERVIVSDTTAATFATADDVAARLGRTLNAGETTSVEYLLGAAASVIADAAGKDDGWAITLDPVPTPLKGLSVELVCRALSNPNSLAALREQIGTYQYSAQFRGDQAGGGLALTDTETLLVRRAVHGRTSGSVQAESGFARAMGIYLWQQRGPIQWIR